MCCGSVIKLAHGTLWGGEQNFVKSVAKCAYSKMKYLENP